jgi:hypothetical protein
VAKSVRFTSISYVNVLFASLVVFVHCPTAIFIPNMNGWQTEEAGRYELGRDLDRASPTNKTTRLSPRNGLKHQMTKSNRNRASLRLRSAQGKVLRAIRVQRA